ncbi:hypothetical protein [Actinomadura sp. 7K507]|uniref:hypothetical protein n=1 Tax=Actinomadura sp. 7K507 TaxID=2530365 RepID=UPI001042D7EF|nr:hypothetical protein [Actinomadura sp. 7K507]TDC74458.1 hypothetical protein E1285_43215 [Actinomadura sp. 7K507]
MLLMTPSATNSPVMAAIHTDSASCFQSSYPAWSPAAMTAAHPAHTIAARTHFSRAYGSACTSFRTAPAAKSAIAGAASAA